MGEFNLLATFTGSLIAALALGYLAHRLKLSPIVGYLLAGVAVGPFTPGFVADRAVAHQLSEIGVILLLFGIGLKFELKELAAVWRVAVPGALIQSAASTLAAAGLLRLLGWSWSAGIVLGLSISVASTVVMAKVLLANRDLHSQIGHIALGWTVVEDILTVVLLLALPMIFGNGDGGAAAAFGLAALKITALAATVAVLGRWVIPAALGKLAATRSAELFTLAVLALALGIAAGASGVFGVSVELGAFLAGLAVGRSEFAARAGGDALPMRDAFAVLFFVSVGMLFDARALAREPLAAAAALFVILAVKPAAAALTARLLGRPAATAIPVGASFAQVGEFTFILAALAQRLGVLGDAGWNAVVAAAIISIALNPSVYAWARGLRAARGASAPAPRGVPPPDPNRCILIGYGPVGSTVHGILAAAGTRVTIVELNLDTARRLRAAGHEVVYGDALRAGLLEEAGVESAGSLILSADLEDGAEIVRRARELNPELRILARCEHLRDAAPLKKAGATLVAAGEAEVAVALAEAVGRAATAKAVLRRQSDIRGRLYDGA